LLAPLAAADLLRLPFIPFECTGNYHLFHIILHDQETRDGLIAYLKQSGITAVFHYVPLHSSPMGLRHGYREGDLPVTEDLSGRLLRLPVYYEITPGEQERVAGAIAAYLQNHRSWSKPRTQGSLENR
jgi:dTDP-4-amino-4,6-dideoxygalactose transaminase